MGDPNLVNVYVGRQPIYTSDLDVYGFELLFRTMDNNNGTPNYKNLDQATSQVIINAFIEIGLERIVEKKLAFISLDRNFIIGKYPLPFPKEQVVLEAVRQNRVDPELTQALSALSKNGYIIALDNFTPAEQDMTLVKSLRIGKVNTRGISHPELFKMIQVLRRFPVKLLADKIETRRDFEFCKNIGFDLFQGNFLAYPNVVSGKRLPARRLAILELLTRVYDPDVNIRELEELIRLDVSLSYKLLRMVNSGFYSISSQVESIRQALVILGLNQLRAWLSLLALTEIDDQPSSLMSIAMIRGRMAELLCVSLGEGQPEKYFSAGLLSTLDAMLALPMRDILASLPLSREINEALLEYKGTLGKILRCVIAYEFGVWTEVEINGLKMAQIRDAYLESIAWASQIKKQLER